MSNEDYDDQEKSGVMRIVKVIIFAMVGLILITSLAVPVLTSIGNRETTLTNTGVPFSDISGNYAEVMQGYDTGSMNIVWNSTGVFLTGTISGISHTNKLVDRNEFIAGNPLIIIHPSSGYSNIIVEYTQPASTFTKYESGGDMITQTSGVQAISIGDQIYVQDPNGTLVLSKNGVYCTDPSQVVGFGYDYDPNTGNSTFIWSDGTNATTIIKE